MALIKQSEGGLVLCGLLDKIRSRPTIFRPVFVQDETFVQDFLDELKVTYSERQQEKMAETTTFKNFCDLIEHLDHGGYKIIKYQKEYMYRWQFMQSTHLLLYLLLIKVIDL